MISPGCTGGNALFLTMRLLMVIFKVYILAGLARPAERDAVVSAHSDGPSLRAAVKGMKPVPDDVHICGFDGHFQRLEDSDALSDIFGSNLVGAPVR